MKSSFSGKVSFSCRKCGSCCNQFSYSLTEKEMLLIKTKLKDDQYEIVANTGSVKHYFPYNVVFKEYYCPFLKNNLCSIYKDRFIICRLYPFDILYLQNNEILVDLIRCNGVSRNEGINIDEVYISSLINDLIKYDNLSYKSFKKFQSLSLNEFVYGFSFNDVVNPEVKINMRKYFNKLINHKLIKDIPIEIKQQAIFMIYCDKCQLIYRKHLDRIGYTDINNKTPIYLLSIDVNSILRDFNIIFEEEILNYVEKSQKSKEKIISDLHMKNKMLIDDEGKMIEKNLEEEIVVIYRNGQKKYVTLKDVALNKNFSKNAISEANKYIIELMNRYGRCGYPITMPLLAIHESLRDISWLVYVQSKGYSSPKKIVNKIDVIEAVSYLDRRSMIVTINRNIVENYKKLII